MSDELKTLDLKDADSAALVLGDVAHYLGKQSHEIRRLKEKEALLDNLMDLVDTRDEIARLKALLDANGIDCMADVQQSAGEPEATPESKPEPEKPKRTRRTKAQIEADKKAEEEAKQAAAKKGAEERVAAVSAEATKQETPAPSQANGDRVLRFKELAAGNFQVAGSLVREAGANRFTELSEAKQDVVLGKLQEQDGPDSLV